MAHAVTHVLLTIILVDIYRDYIAKKKFSLFYVYLAGFFAILPDIDLPIGVILGKDIHGSITHWIYFPIFAFILSYAFYRYYLSVKNTKKNEKLKQKYYTVYMVLLFAGVGLISHSILDCAFGGYQFFYPFSFNFCPQVLNQGMAIWADAIILVSWLIWEWRKHNIKDFI